MQVEMRRLHKDIILETLPWQGGALPSAEITAWAKDKLLSYYVQFEPHYWPREKFRNKAPEEVRVIDDTGKLIARYTLEDVARDLKLILRSIPTGPRCQN
jgi:hypothetical protein